MKKISCLSNLLVNVSVQKNIIFFTHKYVAKTSDLSRVFSTGYVVRVAKYRIIIDSKLINSVTKSYFAKGKSDGPVCRVSEIYVFCVCTLKKWIENDLFF